MIKIFNPIISRRPWPPILISHLFQQGLFSSWLLFFTPVVCFCLNYNTLKFQPFQYCKRGKICWDKLLHFSWFSRAPRKFSHEYLFILYKFRITTLFKCGKRKGTAKVFL